MTVIVAQNTPDKIRGLLKRWFIEPKPNVFVGSVNRRTRDKVLQYLLKYSPQDLALLVICDDPNSQGFRIWHYHDPTCNECSVTGHYLLSTKSALSEEQIISAEHPDVDLQKVMQLLSNCKVEYTLRKS